MARKMFSAFYSLFTLLTVALAASVPKTDYDVIVVGGGPSGLSAISGLSRVLRRTVLFDSGEYRNAPTRNMHDVIGNDGTVPAEFRGAARKQILRYNTSTIIDASISSIKPIENIFEATDASGKTYTARKVVLGTGLRDVLPDTPGLEEAFGKGIFWCPWCDGYEHRDQPFGILGALQDIIGSTFEVYTTLNHDLIAFLNGTHTPEQEDILTKAHPDWRDIVEAYDIRLDNRTITEIERIQDGETHQDDQGRQFDKFLVHFTEGEPVERNAFITNYDTAQRSTIPDQLGLKMLGSKIDTQTNSGLRTSLPGVWAVGDANSDNSTNVPHAMFSGKRAAVFAHVEMAREEAQAAISKRMPERRMLERDTERRMGNEVEALYNRLRRRG